MAGRNQRRSADYFSHDADASVDEKIIYLESKFGHTGYALYFKFLERMTRSADFMLDWNEIKKSVYASEFSISVAEIEQFVSECCREEIKAFRIEDGKIFSPGLLERMRPLVEKREYNRRKYEEQKNNNISGLNNSVAEKTVSATKLTQESKGKESKGKNNPPVAPPLKSYLKTKITEYGFNQYHDKIIEFYEYRMGMPKKDRYRTQKGVDGLIRDLKGCLQRGMDITTCIDIAMERDWKTPNPDYFNAQNIKAKSGSKAGIRSQRNADACVGFVSKMKRSGNE